MHGFDFDEEELRYFTRKEFKHSPGKRSRAQVNGRGAQSASASQPPNVAKQTPLEESDDEDEFGGEQSNPFCEYITCCVGVAHPAPLCEAASLGSVIPPKLVNELALPAGARDKLSAIQTEAVLRADACHETLLPDGRRAGFFLADAAGVGKGRQIAGSVYHNHCKGRKKSLWCSNSADLEVDARRDLEDIGATPEIKIFNLRKEGYAKLTHPEGLMFSTYSTLIAESAKGARHIDQLVDWLGGDDFDGVLVFDESHKAKNGASSGEKKVKMKRGATEQGGKDEEDTGARLAEEGDKEAQQPLEGDLEAKLEKESGTKTARAAIELQKRLPQARVIYASATGASEPSNMEYMERLGLWGKNSHFPDFRTFKAALTKGGYGVMELVACEMKARGLFLARNLSYSGAEFQLHEVPLEDNEQVSYDDATYFWSDLSTALEEAVEKAKEKGLIGPKDPMRVWQYFWAAHQRFFKQLCISYKIPEILSISQTALDKGECVVIGLQSTGEARQLALIKSQKAEDAAMEIEDFIKTPLLIVEDVLKTFFPPTAKAGLDADLNKVTPEDLKWFDDEKEKLLEKAKKLTLPGNPLDELIDRMGGPQNVAELTGRDSRMVKVEGDKYVYTRRNDDLVDPRTGRAVSLDKVNLVEKEAFQNDDKRVCIISDAASAGISLHADRRVKNQRRRNHITMEFAWAADKTVQQLGRTHRSNQVSAPTYHLVITDVAGEKRFASAVAKRLQSLGALTKGDRRAVGATGDHMTAFDIDNKFGDKAVEHMLGILNDEPDAEDLPDEVASIFFTGEQDQEEFLETAKDALNSVGLKKSKRDGKISKLLNRLLGVPLVVQLRIFDFLISLLNLRIEKAKKEGKFNLGIQDITAKHIQIAKPPEIIVKDSHTGATALHYKFDIERGVRFEEAEKKLFENPGEHNGFYTSVHKEPGGRTNYLLAIEIVPPEGSQLRRSKRLKGAKNNHFNIWRPDTGSRAPMLKSELREKWRLQPAPQAVRFHWEMRHDANTNKRQKPVHLFAGAVLPIVASFKRLNITKFSVKRVQPTDGSPAVVGLVVPKYLLKVLKEFPSQGVVDLASLRGGMPGAAVPGGARSLSQVPYSSSSQQFVYQPSSLDHPRTAPPRERKVKKLTFVCKGKTSEEVARLSIPTSSSNPTPESSRGTAREEADKDTGDEVKESTRWKGPPSTQVLKSPSVHDWKQKRARTELKPLPAGQTPGIKSEAGLQTPGIISASALKEALRECGLSTAGCKKQADPVAGLKAETLAQDSLEADSDEDSDEDLLSICVTQKSAAACASRKQALNRPSENSGAGASLQSSQGAAKETSHVKQSPGTGSGSPLKKRNFEDMLGCLVDKVCQDLDKPIEAAPADKQADGIDIGKKAASYKGFAKGWSDEESGGGGAPEAGSDHRMSSGGAADKAAQAGPYNAAEGGMERELTQAVVKSEAVGKKGAELPTCEKSEGALKGRVRCFVEGDAGVAPVVKSEAPVRSPRLGKVKQEDAAGQPVSKPAELIDLSSDDEESPPAARKASPVKPREAPPVRDPAPAKVNPPSEPSPATAPAVAEEGASTEEEMPFKRLKVGQMEGQAPEQPAGSPQLTSQQGIVSAGETCTGERGEAGRTVTTDRLATPSASATSEQDQVPGSLSDMEGEKQGEEEERLGAAGAQVEGRDEKNTQDRECQVQREGRGAATADLSHPAEWTKRKMEAEEGAGSKKQKVEEKETTSGAVESHPLVSLSSPGAEALFQTWQKQLMLQFDEHMKTVVAPLQVELADVRRDSERWRLEARANAELVAELRKNREERRSEARHNDEQDNRLRTELAVLRRELADGAQERARLLVESKVEKEQTLRKLDQQQQEIARLKSELEVARSKAHIECTPVSHEHHLSGLLDVAKNFANTCFRSPGWCPETPSVAVGEWKGSPVSVSGSVCPAASTPMPVTLLRVKEEAGVQQNGNPHCD